MCKNKIIPSYVDNVNLISNKDLKKYSEFLIEKGFLVNGTATGATCQYVTLDTPNRRKIYSLMYTKDRLIVQIGNNNSVQCHNTAISTGVGKVHWKECALNDLIPKFDTLFIL